MSFARPARARASAVRTPEPSLSLLVFTSGAFVIAGLLILYTKWENKQRDAGKRDHRLEGLSEDEIAVLGSRHPAFRYLS